MKVRFTQPASADVDNVLAYISQHSPLGADRVKASIEATTKLLEGFPLIGVETRLPWLRRVKVPSYPYLIFYEVTLSEVVVHAV